MKLLYKQYKHYTEVLLPQKLKDAGLSTTTEHMLDDKHIKSIIAQATGIPVPTYPSRQHTTTHNLRRLVSFCQQLEQNPVILLVL
jgi:hypothetical protein